MLIQPIQKNIYAPTPQFKGNNRTIYSKDGALLYKTVTYFFREDLCWNDLVRLIAYKYKSSPKVNIINHACSNGQEPYSLAVKLIQTLGEEAEKFFPIQAKDIDFENIESAKIGRMGIKLNDMYRINGATSGQLDTFFHYGRANNPQNDMVLIPKPNIKDKVSFTQSNIFDDIDKIPSQDTVLLCRNFWPYLDASKRILLAQKLAEKLDKTSLIVVGGFDESCYTENLLLDNGFINCGVNHVFTKP